MKHLDKVKRPDKLILLAKRLEKLPRVDAAFNSGEVPWTKIREIARIATPDTEQVWLEKARRLTSRQLEEEVAGKKRGDRPGGGLKARRLKSEERLRFRPEQQAIWEKGIRMMMKELGRGATPDKAAVEIMRRTLARARQDNAAPTPSERVASRETELLVYHVKLWQCASNDQPNRESGPGVIPPPAGRGDAAPPPCTPLPHNFPLTNGRPKRSPPTKKVETSGAPASERWVANSSERERPSFRRLPCAPLASTFTSGL